MACVSPSSWDPPGRDRVAGRSVVEPRTRLESSTEISMADEVEPVIGHQDLPCDNHEAGHGATDGYDRE
jgi:hypothetical protein